MPFTPELFSARVLERLEEQRRHELASVPYFDGLLAWIDHAVQEGFIKPQYRKLLQEVREPEELLSTLVH